MQGYNPYFFAHNLCSNRSEISTGQHITAKVWDSNKGHVKGNSKETKAINTHLKILKTKILTAYDELLGCDYKPKEALPDIIFYI